MGRTKTTTDNLVRTLRDMFNPGPTAKDDVLTPLLDAFENGRVHFLRETWHDLDVGSFPREQERGEYLMRAVTADGTPINPEPLSSSEGGIRGFREIDRLVSLTALDQAIKRNELPISINISSRMAEDGKALTGLHDLFQSHFAGRYHPGQITFEFLEDYPADNPDVGALAYMRDALGYSFALDDVSHHAEDANRLRNLGPHMDFIKIDGKTFDQFRSGKMAHEDFDGFINRVALHADQATLICEWVSTPEEAQELGEVYPQIRFVQGRDIDDEQGSFARRVENWSSVPDNRFLDRPLRKTTHKKAWAQLERLSLKG